MKKMLKAFILVLALVVFAGTVSAEEINVNGLQQSNGTLTIKYVNTYDGEVEIFKNTYSNDTSNEFKVYDEKQLHNKLKLSNAYTSYKTNSNGTKDVFMGWYTIINGEEVPVVSYEKDSYTFDGVKISNYVFHKEGKEDKISISSLTINVPKLEEDKEIVIYAKWIKNVYTPKITVNVYDNKAYKTNKVNKTKILSRSLDTINSSPALYIDLDQLFLNDKETGYLRYSNSTKSIKFNNSPVEYKFSRYVDSNGIELNENYSSNIIYSAKVLETRKNGSNNYTNSLEIIFNNALTANLTEDVTLNIYVEWEEYTTAILEHEFIDYVSDGDGSACNTTGGATSYTHTFSDPSIASPRSHYKFLYWQFEQSTPADDQIDATKKYKAGEKFTYTLTGKKSGWKGKVTSYAWWQPDVTVNLYSDGRLFSSKSSFESVSIEGTPVKFGYKFLGWFDEDGNKVTETTFNANKAGTNPEVKEITLYARFERIMVDVKVSKVWDDENNNDGKRPTSVTVELKDGDKVVETAKLSKANNWTYTFNVAKFNDKNEIAYTVSENEVKDYTTVITGTVKDGFVITNTHEVEIIENVSVKKVWNDKNNEDEIRPSSVTIYLLANGEKVAEVVLNEGNNWEASFENLKVYEDGEEIEYTISENEIEYYTTEIIGSVEKGFVITNTHEVWPKGQGGDDFEVVQTGSESSLSLSVILLFIELLIVRKKRLS